MLTFQRQSTVRFATRWVMESIPVLLTEHDQFYSTVAVMLDTSKYNLR